MKKIINNLLKDKKEQLEKLWNKNKYVRQYKEDKSAWYWRIVFVVAQMIVDKGDSDFYKWTHDPIYIFFTLSFFVFMSCLLYLNPTFGVINLILFSPNIISFGFKRVRDGLVFAFGKPLKTE